MRFRRPYVASILAAALLLASLSVRSTAERKALQQNSPTVVFAVYGTQPSLAQIEPFVVIEQGQFKNPVAGDSDGDEIQRFADAHYVVGRKYRLLFGGGPAGSLTVKNTERGECFRTGVEVSLQTQTKLNRNVMALATNSDSLGGKATRRSPTPAERAAVLPLVRAAYRQNGVPAALASSPVTVNLTALDLDGDGKADLVGSFVVKKKTRPQARYPLFLIAVPDGGKYRTAVANYARYTDKDIMGGGDLDAVGESGIYTERLLDGLDLDGDSTSEIITVTDGFEGVTYVIYKQQGAKWNEVYEFGNYRCAF